MTTPYRDDVTRSSGEIAQDHLRWLDDAPRSRTDRARSDAPVGALQATALAASDPFLRARCLAVLDHVANEASTHVFLAALADPVVDVRRNAVHGLTCERCRSTELCLTDVVPTVADALARERDGEIRHQLVVVLGRFAPRSEAARETLVRVAADDPDPLLRAAADAMLATGHTRARKALQRLARR